LIIGAHDKEFTEFQLSMDFPVIEESQDRLRMKNDTLRLANDVLSNIQNALGTRDGLPPEVIKLVFSKLSFLDQDEVDFIVDKSVEGLSNTQESIVKLRERLNEEVILSSYFDSMKELNIREGVHSNRHFINSYISTKESQEMFNIIRMEKGSSGKIDG